MSDADITRAIAFASLAFSGLALFLNWRQHRATGKVGVRIVVTLHKDGYYGDDPAGLLVTFSNPERRTVTVQRAGVAVRKGDLRKPFDGWDQISLPNATSTKGHVFLGGMVSPLYQGLELEPGSPARSIHARLHRIKAATFPKLPQWVWCEDSNGRPYWQPIPRQVQTAFILVKVKRLVRRTDDYNSPVVERVEVEDRAVTADMELDVHPG